MSRALSDVLESAAHTLEDSEQLTTLGGVIEVNEFVDVLEHAAAIAAEVEHEADRAANLAQTATTPAYPPLVALLARALVTDAPAVPR